MKRYIGALFMFLAATAMGVTVIAAGLELVSTSHGALAFLLAIAGGWTGACLVGEA